MRDFARQRDKRFSLRARENETARLVKFDEKKAGYPSAHKFPVFFFVVFTRQPGLPG